MRVSICQTTKVFIISKPQGNERIIEAANFRWNPLLGRYETAKIRNAVRLRSHFDENCENQISKISCRILDPWTDGISIPTTEKLDRIQRLGVLHALERNHSYIAFEQGVGKTPTAIAAINSFGKRVVVLLPPALIAQWRREIEKWKTRKIRVEAIETAKDVRIKHITADILLCPDSLIGNGDICDGISQSAAPFLIIEEAHRFCNWTALRTQTLFGGVDSLIPNGLTALFDKVMLLSGTPMPNRPMELHPVLSRLAANTIDYRDQHEYGVRYCGGFQNQFGWDFKGATNLEELQRKIHGVFMRREEKDSSYTVKTKNVVFLGGKSKKIERLETAILSGRLPAKFSTDFQKNHIKDNKILGQLARLRVEIGRLKIPESASWVRNILESTNASVLLLGYHQDAIQRMERRLKEFLPVVIHGKTPMRERDKRVQRFQKGQTRLMIANLLTMVGLNLDKTSRVVFFEYAWTPKDNNQALDRAHRRTSEHDVLVEFLVLTGTLDEYMLKAAEQTKTKILNQVISKPKRRSS